MPRRLRFRRKRPLRRRRVGRKRLGRRVRVWRRRAAGAVRRQLKLIRKEVRRQRPERKLIYGSDTIPWDNSINCAETSTFSDTTQEWTGFDPTGAKFAQQYVLNKVGMYVPNNVGTGGAVAAPMAMSQVVRNFAPPAHYWDPRKTIQQGSLLTFPGSGIRIGNEVRMHNLTMRMRFRCPIITSNQDSTAANPYLANPEFGRVWVALVLVNYDPIWDPTNPTKSPPVYVAGDPIYDNLKFTDLFEPPRFPYATTLTTEGSAAEEGIVGLYTPYSSPAERVFYSRRRSGKFLQQGQATSSGGYVAGGQQLQAPRINARVIWQKKLKWKPIVSSNHLLDSNEALNYSEVPKGRLERNIGVKIRFKGRKVTFADASGDAPVSAATVLNALDVSRALDSRPTRNQLRLIYYDNYRIIYPGTGAMGQGPRPRLLSDPTGARFYFEYNLGITDN